MGTRIAEAFVEVRSKTDRARAEARAAASEIARTPITVPMGLDAAKARADAKAVADGIERSDVTITPQLDGRPAINQARSTAQELTRTFVQYFSAAVFADQIGEAIQAASDLEQAVGGTQATFQEAAGIIDAFARTSAESFGLSENAARTLTSQIGGLLKGFGFTRTEAAQTSVQIAQLGADLAATFGGRPEEAVEALGAALRGEFNPLERFGISLNVAQINLKAMELGLGDAAKAGDLNARAQAALALIMERSADAQGQFAREADTAAGRQAILTAKWEDARAKLGAELLPVFVRAVDLLTRLVDGFSALPGPVQTAVVALAGIAVVSGPIKRVTDGLGGLTNAVRNLRIMSPATGTAVLTIGVALSALALNAAHAAREAEQARRSIEDLGRASDDQLVSRFAESLVALAFSGQEGADGIAEIARQSPGVIARLLELEDANGAVTAGLIELGQSRQEAVTTVNRLRAAITEEARATQQAEETNRAGAEALGQSTEAAGTASTAWTGLGGAIDFVSRQFDNARTAAEDTVEPLGEGRDALEDLRSEAEAARDAAEQLATALRDVFGGTDVQAAVDRQAEAFDKLELQIRGGPEVARKLEEAHRALADGNQEAADAAFAEADALRDANRTLDRNTEAGRANRAAIRENVDAIVDLASEAIEHGRNVDRVTNRYERQREALIRQVMQFGLTRQEAERYVNQLGLTPDRIDTAVELQGDENAKDRIQRVIDRLGEVPEEERTEIQALIDEGALAEAERRLNVLARQRVVAVTPAVTAASTVIRESAAGRYADRPMLSTLAEEGPEAVLPLTNEQRMRQLLADPRIAIPIFRALGVAAMANGGVAGNVAGINFRNAPRRSRVLLREAVGLAGDAAEQYEFARALRERAKATEDAEEKQKLLEQADKAETAAQNLTERAVNKTERAVRIYVNALRAEAAELRESAKAAQARADALDEQGASLFQSIEAEYALADAKARAEDAAAKAERAFTIEGVSAEQRAQALRDAARAAIEAAEAEVTARRERAEAEGRTLSEERQAEIRRDALRRAAEEADGPLAGELRRIAGRAGRAVRLERRESDAQARANQLARAARRTENQARRLERRNIRARRSRDGDDVEVRVFIGNKELTEIVDTQVRRRNRQATRRARAGSR